MRKTIWKCCLEIIPGWQEFEFPGFAGVAMVGNQNGILSVWVFVDLNAERKFECFMVVGTGHSVPLNGDHVGSAIVPPYVWHVYRNTGKLSNLVSSKLSQAFTAQNRYEPN